MICLDLEATNGIQSQYIDKSQTYVQNHFIIGDATLRRLHVMHCGTIAQKMNVEATVFRDVSVLRIYELRIWLKNICGLIRRSSPFSCGSRLGSSPQAAKRNELDATQEMEINAADAQCHVSVCGKGRTGVA